MEIAKRWYTVTTQAGKEHEAKENIEARIVSMNMQNYIFQVFIAEEEVVTVKKLADGKEKTTKKMKNLYPRYIFVQMIMTDESWFIVRNTPLVTGIVGSSGKGTKPMPVPEEDMITVLKNGGCYTNETASVFKVGQKVRAVKGMMKGQEFIINEVYPEEFKVNVSGIASNGIKIQDTILEFADVEPIEG